MFIMPMLCINSRDGKNDISLGGDRVYLGNGGSALRILDPESGEERAPILKDMYNIGRIMDKMENINSLM